MPHTITGRRQQKVGIDLFEFNNVEYLVTVDYFPNFWEVDRLEDTTVATVITLQDMGFHVS